MFDLVFLGTAATVPTPDRGLAGLLVEHGADRFLVDCGEGTQRQILTAGLGFRRLHTVLLTHGHLDHLLGLAGLASTLNLWNAAPRLAVRGGATAVRLAELLLHQVAWPAAPPALQVGIESVRPGEVVHESRDLRVTAFAVTHRGPDSLGYLFEQRRGRAMRPDRLEALGVPRGPLRGRLSRGETVRLPDGRTVEPAQVLEDPGPGARLAVVGDTEEVETLVDRVRGVDLLVIEGTFLEQDAALAAQRSHLTVAHATELARRAGVGALCITHLSSRHPESAYLEQARAGFRPCWVARDFLRLRVRAGAVEEPATA